MRHTSNDQHVQFPVTVDTCEQLHAAVFWWHRLVRPQSVNVQKNSLCIGHDGHPVPRCMKCHHCVRAYGVLLYLVVDCDNSIDLLVTSRLASQVTTRWSFPFLAALVHEYRCVVAHRKRSHFSRNRRLISEASVWDNIDQHSQLHQRWLSPLGWENAVHFWYKPISPVIANFGSK